MEIPSEDEVEVVRDFRDVRGAHFFPGTGPNLRQRHARQNRDTAPAPNELNDEDEMISEDELSDVEEVFSSRTASSHTTIPSLTSRQGGLMDEGILNFGTPQMRYEPLHNRAPAPYGGRRGFRRPPRVTDPLPRNSTPVRVPLRPSFRVPLASANPRVKKPQHDGLRELTGILTRLSQQLHVLSQRRLAEKAAANALEEGPSPETCPICFDAFHCPGTCTTRCGHVFHRKCLDACLDNSRACPVCRANVHKAELIDLMSGYGELVNSEEAVVDLINEPGEAPGELDESILKAVASVKESIDRAQAVDKLDTEIRSKNQELERKVELRVRELEEGKTIFEKMVEEERGNLEKRKQRVQKGEEVVAEKDRELNQALCDARKREAALQIREGEVEATVTENERVRQALEKERSDMREKVRRMAELTNAQKFRKLQERSDDASDRVAALEQLLRRHKIALPEDAEKEETPAPGRDAFRMDLDSEITVVESPVKRRKVNAPAKPASAAFGGELRKPSSYSRPAPPRRSSVSVRSFAPTKKTAPRIGGVAQRGLGCFTKR